jgi:type IV secretion system protein VirB6
MSAVCPAISDGAGFAERLAAYVECQSARIDVSAFQGGLWHGLPAALVSVLMVLYVAGIGYRLLLHRDLDMAGLVYAALRLGVVVAVATTFSAYSALFYTVATQGPAELAAMALAPAGLHAPSPTEASRAAADALISLAGVGPKASPAARPASVPASADPAAKAPPASSFAGSGVDLGGAVFVLSCAGFGLAARLAQAIVLAAGPLFIAAALFDLSTGLFIGWLRALVALFLAQAGYAVSSALELSFFVQDLARPEAADGGEPLLVGLFFLAGGVAITAIALLAAGGLRRFGLVRRVGTSSAEGRMTATPPVARSPWTATEVRLDQPVSRAQRISDAVGALAVTADQRQTSGRDGAGAMPGAAGPGTAPDSLAGPAASLRRPGQLRASSGAARRDKIS